MAKFKVIREHIGDRPYVEGEIREADARDVAHLVPRVLEPIGADAKAKAKPASKPAMTPKAKAKGSKPAKGA